MTRRDRRIAWVIVVLLAVAASGFSCLVQLGRSRPVERGEPVRLVSPDTRWTLSVRDELGPLVSHVGYTSAVLTRADSSDARTVYFGALAHAEWRGPASVLFIEIGSGRRHEVTAPGGSYDYRFDEPRNLAAFVIYAAVPGVIVALVGALVIRRTSRTAARVTESGRPTEWR